MTIDGVEQPLVVSTYNFGDTNEHTITLDLKDGVTSIGYDAFEECSNLTSIDIPNGITSIGYKAFYDCSGLTSCIIGSSVTSIGESAFNGCIGLTNIIIPSSVTSIGDYAFYNCSSLNEVIINATTPPTLGTDAFETNNTIYVPCESVDTYKAATKWSNYTIEGTPPCDEGGSDSGSESQSLEYVEIAGIKWAIMNVGANSVTDTGLYFQWGDTQGYTADQVGDGEGLKYFDWEDYKYAELDANGGGNGSGSGSGSGSVESVYHMTKYNETDGLTVLQPSDDAVTAAWGGNWRMPTTEEYAALGNAVNVVWTADYQGSGVAGIICTDKTDSSKVLFFPAAGFCVNGSVDYVGSRGYYWSSSLSDDDVSYARSLRFSSGGVGWSGNDDRYSGFAVRGVLSK